MDVHENDIKRFPGQELECFGTSGGNGNGGFPALQHLSNDKLVDEVVLHDENAHPMQCETRDIRFALRDERPGRTCHPSQGLPFQPIMRMTGIPRVVSRPDPERR